MPADAALRDEFVQVGAKKFLGKYFVTSKAGSLQQTYGGGGRVAAIAGIGAHPPSDANRAAGTNVETSTAPPVVWTFFIKERDWPPPQIPTTRQVFRSRAEVQFDGADTGGLGVQCYVLPSLGDAAMGIRLPANGNALYMFTTTQDGCTFKVSGDPLSPFVSHTNASAAAWANKPAILNTRLQALDAAFDPGNHRVQGNDPTVNVGKLDYFDSNDPNGLGFGSVRANSPVTLQHMQNLLNGTSFKDRQDNHWYSHKKITWSLSQLTVNRLNDPQLMPNALVIGQRTGPNQPWSFFYQETVDVELVKHTQTKARDHAR